MHPAATSCGRVEGRTSPAAEPVADFSAVSSVGDDRWDGGPGNDHLTDFAGADRVIGGSGADRCLATEDGVGDDTIRGGSGRDTGDADGGDTVIGVEVRGRICYAD